MTKRPNAKLRTFGSAVGWRRVGKSGLTLQAGHFVKRNSLTGKFIGGRVDRPALKAGARVYIGPSVEGGDVEYIERVSGKVSERKPSFAR